MMSVLEKILSFEEKASPHITPPHAAGGDGAYKLRGKPTQTALR